MSDAARVRALAKNVRKPKFALGQPVVDPHDERGAVDAIYADLQSAEDAGVVDDAASFLKAQEKRPKSKKTDLWYSVVCETGGQVLVGEADLRAAK